MRYVLLLIVFFFSLKAGFSQNVKIRNGKYFPIQKDRGFVNELFEFKRTKVQLTKFHCTPYKFRVTN
jgi:hypothetical protein